MNSFMSSRLALVFGLLGGALSSCGPPPPPPVELASIEETDEEIAELVNKALAELRLDLEDPERRVKLALIYEANDLWDEAHAAWVHAIEMSEESGTASLGVQVYHRALCARQMGEIELAEELMGSAAQLAPNLAAAHFELASMKLENGELEASEGSFKRASLLAPQAPDPIVGLAFVRLGQDDFKEAESLARRGLAIDPSLKRARYGLGIALRGQGRLEEAERELTLGLGATRRSISDPLSKRIQSYKTGYQSKISRAVNLVNSGDPAGAVRLLVPLLDAHSRDEALLNNLAVAYTQTGAHEKAREVLLKLILVKPGSFAAYINLTNAELELGMNAEALKHGEAAVRYGPEIAKTRFVRARAYIAYKRWNEAYADLKKAVQIQAEDWIHHFFLGEVCQELSRHEEALRAFEQALLLNSNARHIWLELGFSAAYTGKLKRATEAHQRAAQFQGANDPRVQALGQLILGR
jgi:tetratricopeptide (TPR) repeat protein